VRTVRKRVLRGIDRVGRELNPKSMCMDGVGGEEQDKTRARETKLEAKGHEASASVASTRAAKAFGCSSSGLVRGGAFY
jgi:hypothetical protein